MKITLRLLSAFIAAVIIASVIPLTASANDGIIMDGIVAYYDGANNSNGKQDLNASIWRDLSGNGYHFSVETDENTKWTENAFHVDKKRTYFNENVRSVANAKQYTIEMAFGELEYYGTDWLTLVASDNDEFSMFIRVQDGLDDLEYKYNDNNRDRPIAKNGRDLVSNSTLTVTFDIDEPICKIYIDGELVSSSVPVEINIADTLFFGHENPKRSWSGDVYSFRFYDRVLSVEEIKHNSMVDDDKYRSGKPYTPEVVDTGAAEVTEREHIDYNIGDVITVVDFSDPEMFNKMIKAEPQRCTLEMDDSGAVKVTVTGAQPYFYVPIDETNSFDGDKFTTLIFNYKTGGGFEDNIADIYFSTKYSEVYFTDNHISFDIDAADDFTDLEVNMRDDDNDTWHHEIRMIRVDFASYAAEPGQELYIRSLKARYDDPNITTDAVTEPEPETTEATVTDKENNDSTAEVTSPVTDTDKARTTGSDNTGNSSKTGIIIGIIAAVAVIAAVCVVLFLKKKNKKADPQ